MASEYWYEVYTYGASEEEKANIFKRITGEYEIQDFNGESDFGWGGSWGEMEDIMTEVSGEFPHVLFVVTVDYKDYDDSPSDKYYFGGGAKQEDVTVDCRVDAVSERILSSRLDRENLPGRLLCGGAITATGAGSLVRISPKVENGVLTLLVKNEEGNLKNILTCRLSDLLVEGAVRLIGLENTPKS